MVSSLFSISIILGVCAFWSYSDSEIHLHDGFKALAEKGAQLNSEGCVPAVLEWHRTCKAMKSLCDHAVPMAMAHCLKQPKAPDPRNRERAAYCKTLKYPPGGMARWTYSKCSEIGITRKKGHTRSEVKACGTAFSALENFCRHDGDGIRL